MLLCVNVIFTSLHVIRIHDQAFLELIHSLLPIFHIDGNHSFREMIVILMIRSDHRLSNPVKVLHSQSVLHHILKRITPVAVKRIRRIIQQWNNAERILAQTFLIMNHGLIVVSTCNSTIAFAVLPTIKLGGCVRTRQKHQHRSHNNIKSFLHHLSSEQMYL